MKTFLFVLSFLMLLKPVVPVVEYAVNYNYISKVLCVNKAKPMMHCNGKCHLMKELAKAAEEEKPISSDKKASSYEQEVLFFQAIEPFLLPFRYIHIAPKINTDRSGLYVYLGSYSIFRPPIVCFSRFKASAVLKSHPAGSICNF